MARKKAAPKKKVADVEAAAPKVEEVAAEPVAEEPTEPEQPEPEEEAPAGYSQAQVAEMVGLSAPTLSRWVTEGLIVPSVPSGKSGKPSLWNEGDVAVLRGMKAAIDQVRNLSTTDIARAYLESRSANPTHVVMLTTKGMRKGFNENQISSLASITAEPILLFPTPRP